MDRVVKYRQIVRGFLESFVADYDRNAQLVFDSEHDHYLVMHNEWRGYARIYGCAMHVDIIESQIWIQQNSTEIYIDREFIQLGVDPKDIVFGFREPGIRQRLTAALVDSY